MTEDRRFLTRIAALPAWNSNAFVGRHPRAAQFPRARPRALSKFFRHPSHPAISMRPEERLMDEVLRQRSERGPPAISEVRQKDRGRGRREQGCARHRPDTAARYFGQLPAAVACKRLAITPLSNSASPSYTSDLTIKSRDLERSAEVKPRLS